MIEVYHISDAELIRSIVNDGLKTLQLQSDEGLINLDETIKKKGLGWFIPEELLSFRLTTNYFILDQPQDDVSWISILVDENKTDVANNNLEYIDADIYYSSFMSIYSYLLNSEGKTENLHPITAVPFQDRESIRCLSRQGRKFVAKTYNPEVIVSDQHIVDFCRYNIA